MNKFEIRQGDCLERLREMADGSVHCCVTSPPYFGLRDYGHDGQIGLEETPEAYVAKLAKVFRQVWRVLKNDGTLWLNIGDSYASKYACDRRSQIGNGSPDETCKRPNRLTGDLKEKDLIGVPWMLAFALRTDGWYLRSDIIWHKPNPMPESVTDRPTKAHEYVFLLSKSERYYYDAEAIAEPVVAGFNGSTFTKGKSAAPRLNVGQGPRNDGETRNKRSVWTITTKPFSEAHFATFPPDLIKPCILAGCPEGGTVLDPFNGAGTTGVVALRNGRQYIGLELNPEYVEMSRRRILSDSPLFNQEVA